jgi:hypothetical protein
MSVAPPPDPIVPIFNPLYWEVTPEGAGGITPTYLNLNYLKFPYAQGLENLQNTNIVGTLAVSGTTTLNDPLQVNDLCNITGALTVSGITTLNDPLQVNDTATVTGTMTASGTVILGGALATIPTSLGDYSAVTPTDSSTKIPTTAWVQTAISAGVAPTTPILLTYSGATTSGTFTPAFPAGTVYIDILLMAGGGASGTGGVVFNSSNAGYGGGGAGGAGGTVYIQRLSITGANTIYGNITQGVSAYVQYQGSFGGTNIATAYWGGNGGNGSFSGPNACVGGAGGAAGGTSSSVPAQAVAGTAGSTGGQQNGVYQVSTPPPWPLNNNTSTGGVNYLSKSFGLQTPTYGATSTLNGTTGAITYEAVSVGAIYFWCYKA